MSKVEDLIREASRDVQNAVATLPDRRAPRARRTLKPVLVVAGAVVAVFLLLGLPPMFLTENPRELEVGSDGTVASTPTTSTPTSGESEIPPEVLEYWALEGTLESVGVEEGWLCPARGNIGYTSVISDAEVPQELKLEIPDLEHRDVFNRDAGPSCHQPPLLVLLAEAGGGSELTFEAGMSVWPQLSRFEDTCPEDYCAFDGGPVDELTINDQPARLHAHSETGHYDAWWIDASGTPMYAEASGMDRDRVLELIESIEVDPAVHRAVVDPDSLGDLNVALNQESRGVWEAGHWRMVSYEVDGTDVAITTSYDSAFDPYARFAPFVDQLMLVEVHDSLAVWVPEGGNFLMYTNGDGIRVFVEGFVTIEVAVHIAEQLQGS